MNQTVLIVIGVLVLWAILMVPFMWWQKKRKEAEASFLEENKDHVILHLYCSNTSIDGQKLSAFHPVRGENLQKIVKLTPGKHTISAIFETTELGLGHNVKLKSEQLTFDISFEAGHQYTLGIYSYSPEDRKNYYKGEVGVDVFSLPLTLYEGSKNIKAYVICYQET